MVVVPHAVALGAKLPSAVQHLLPGVQAVAAAPPKVAVKLTCWHLVEVLVTET
jgi:hypothetical protein